VATFSPSGRFIIHPRNAARPDGLDVAFLLGLGVGGIVWGIGRARTGWRWNARGDSRARTDGYGGLGWSVGLYGRERLYVIFSMGDGERQRLFLSCVRIGVFRRCSGADSIAHRASQGTRFP